MSNAEAKSLLSEALQALAKLSYDDLVAKIGHADLKNITGEWGVNYQIDLNVLWDPKPERDLRIMGSIDDGKWRAFLPLTDSLIMNPTELCSDISRRAGSLKTSPHRSPSCSRCRLR